MRTFLAALIGLPIANAAPVAHSQNSNPEFLASGIQGEIRIWGSSAMAEAVDRWEAGFRKLHPLVSFENRLLGSDIGIAGLYTGKADGA